MCVKNKRALIILILKQKLNAFHLTRIKSKIIDSFSGIFKHTKNVVL